MKYKLKYITVLIFLFLPVLGIAAGVEPYQPLVGIPGVDDASNINAYINALYALSIAIAALLAVIKIIIAGVKWMLSDIVTDKSEAKKDIWNATIGLIIVIAAVLILGVINPQLTETNVFVNEIVPPEPQEPLGTGADPGDSEIIVPNSAAGENRCTNDPKYEKGSASYAGGAGPNGESVCVVPEGSLVDPRKDIYRCAEFGQNPEDVNCTFQIQDCIDSNGVPAQEVGLEIPGQERQLKTNEVRCWPEIVLCDPIYGNTGDGQFTDNYTCSSAQALCPEGQGQAENGIVRCDPPEFAL